MLNLIAAQIVACNLCYAESCHLEYIMPCTLLLLCWTWLLLKLLQSQYTIVRRNRLYTAASPRDC